MAFARTFKHLADPTAIDPILDVEELAILVGLRQRIGLKLREAARAGFKIGKLTPPADSDLTEIDVARVVAATRSGDLARATGIKLHRVRMILRASTRASFAEGARIAQVLHMDPLRLALYLEGKNAQRRARRKFRRFSPEARALLADVMREASRISTLAELKDLLAQANAVLSKAGPGRSQPGAEGHGPSTPDQTRPEPDRAAEGSDPNRPGPHFA